MRTLSTEEVVELLRRGEPVRDARVSDPLDLRVLCDGDSLRVPVRLAGCHLSVLSAVCVQFHEPVVLEDCTLEAAPGAFFAAYFLGGLQISRCSFRSGVDFQCGGHNQGPRTVLIEDTTFEGFVNFLDCWFTGPVMVRRCRFEGGSNLLGNKGRPFAVQFDVPPVVEDDVGDLGLDGG
jgi:hypothetical protein